MTSSLPTTDELLQRIRYLEQDNSSLRARLYREYYGDPPTPERWRAMTEVADAAAALRWYEEKAIEGTSLVETMEECNRLREQLDAALAKVDAARRRSHD